MTQPKAPAATPAEPSASHPETVPPLPEAVPERPLAPPVAAFVTGSTMRHVVVMTATGSLGLLSVFIVDALGLFYLGLKGDTQVTAAIGYASALMFFLVSMSIGLSISGTALVSRALGAGERARARDVAAAFLVQLVGTMALGTLTIVLLSDWLFGLLGAHGRTAEMAHRYMVIVSPGMVLFALGMGYSSILRAVGDARRSMNVTLVGGFAAAALDPLFILGLDMSLDGAAIATAMARAVLVFVGYHGAVRVHGLVARPSLVLARRHAAALWAIALPAVLTNVATPVANGFIVSIISRYGDAMVAASTVIDRLVPLAFCAIFALSGSVGPILGQNFGARRFDRLRSTLRDAFIFVAVYMACVWTLLALAGPYVAIGFGLQGEAAELVTFFCRVAVGVWSMLGALFVANAAFNTLGYPLFATFFNWGRATIGTIPLAILGAHQLGPKGILLGVGGGSFIFGILAAVTAFLLIRRMAMKAAALPSPALRD